jgi:tRNA-2-methylthio-N6-dimethylallyladenosine synthase
MSDPKTYYVETYGCQMNVSDSELIGSLLDGSGYRPASGPEDADILLVNTCCVRQRAEDRALGRIKSLTVFKKERPEVVLGVVGCMAENFKEELLELVPELDLVVGPARYRGLSELIGELSGNGSGKVAVGSAEMELYDDIAPRQDDPFRAWVAISRGCDNCCSYCIVPAVRGSLRSRPAETILKRVSELAADGVPQVCLLGQNVNAYGDGRIDFAGLLDLLARESGMPWIRFLTSHPSDLTRRTLEVMAAHDSICKHLHLPLQSGSDRILEAMGRGYTAGHYLDLVATARELMPELTLTSDIIVGFPGEEEADFQATLAVAEVAAFHSAYTFIYSTRPGTPAADLPDQLPRETKLKRLKRLIALEQKLSLESSERIIGSQMKVLVEGPSKHDDILRGRTPGNGVVVFSSRQATAGSFIHLRIDGVKGRTLTGVPVEDPQEGTCG